MLLIFTFYNEFSVNSASSRFETFRTKNSVCFPRNIIQTILPNSDNSIRTI